MLLLVVMVSEECYCEPVQNVSGQNPTAASSLVHTSFVQISPVHTSPVHRPLVQASPVHKSLEHNSPDHSSTIHKGNFAPPPLPHRTQPLSHVFVKLTYSPRFNLIHAI